MDKLHLLIGRILGWHIAMDIVCLHLERITNFNCAWMSEHSVPGENRKMHMWAFQNTNTTPTCPSSFPYMHAYISHWPPIVPTGPLQFLTVPLTPIQISLAPYRSHWPPIVPTGPLQIHYTITNPTTYKHYTLQPYNLQTLHHNQPYKHYTITSPTNTTS